VNPAKVEYTFVACIDKDFILCGRFLCQANLLHLRGHRRDFEHVQKPDENDVLGVADFVGAKRLLHSTEKDAELPQEGYRALTYHSS
jgi:hypothetical protein